MRRFVSVLTVLATALAVCFGGALRCAAEEEAAEKPVPYLPVLKVAFAGVTAVEAELKAVGELAEEPALADLVRAYYQDNLDEMFKLAENGGPMGICFMMKGEDEYDYIFLLPLTIEELTNFIMDNSSSEISIVENEDGTASINTAGENLYLKQCGSVLVGCMKEEHLKLIPADGVSFWEGLHDRYTVGVKVYVKNFPEKYQREVLRQMIPGGQEIFAPIGRDTIEDEDGNIVQVEVRGEDDENAGENADAAAKPETAEIKKAPESDESVEERELNEKMRAAGKTLEAYANSVETVEAGYKLNLETCEAKARAEVTLAQGSELSALMKKLREQKPQFAGVRHMDAMHRAYFIGMQEDFLRNLEPVYLTHIRIGMPDASDEDDVATMLVKQVLTPAIELVESVLDQDVLEMAAATDVEIGGINAFFVTTMKENQASATLLKTAQEMIVKYPEQTKDIRLEMNVENWNGFQFHRATMRFEDLVKAIKTVRNDNSKIDDDLKKVMRAFGDDIRVTVGVAKDKLFIGYGDKSVEMLKQAMTPQDSTVTEAVPVGFANFSLEKWMPYYVGMYDIFAGVGDELSRNDRREKNGFRMSADVLASLPGQGDIYLEIRPLSDTRMEYSLTAEKGVMKLLGSLPTIVNFQEMHDQAKSQRTYAPSDDDDE